MYRSFLILSITALLSGQARGQFSLADPVPRNWQMVEVPVGTSMFLYSEYIYAFEKGVLTIGEDDLVVAVYDKTLGYALIRLQGDAEEKWKSPVPGYILGIAKLNDKLVAFYAREWSLKERGRKIISDVGAIVIDPETGKKLHDKAVYRNESKKFIEPCILNKSDGQFGQLLIRQTEYNGYALKKMSVTSGITLIGLNDQLATQYSTAVTSEARKNEYLGTVMNDKGETFIATDEGKQIVIEKFDAKQAFAGKLATAAGNPQFGVILRINRQNDQSVLAVIKGAKGSNAELSLYDFDFAAQKVVTARQQLNKELAKTLRARNKESGEKQADFEAIQLSKLVGLLQTDDKIIAVLDERSSSGRGMYGNDMIGPAVVLFFDRKLNLVNSLAIAKRYYMTSHAYWACSLGYHIDDGKLLLVSNNGEKNNNKSAIVISIDLATMKAGKPFYTEIKHSVVEGAATLWFKKRFYMTDGNSTRKITY